MPRALRSVDLHYYSRNKAELKVLLGREPDGGVSPEQALALLEHLRWLDGLMPSERIRLEQAVRREHKLEVFSGFRARYKWEHKKPKKLT